MKNFWFVVIVIVLYLQIDVVATFRIRQTLRGLVNGSPLITTATVSQISSKIEKNPYGGDAVYTYVVVNIKTILKGNVNNPSLTVKMLGGRVNGKGSWSEEWIPFKINEEVLLFLHPINNENNIWEMKTPSAKLPIIKNNGTRYFDCSELYPDELSKNNSFPLLDEKLIIDMVKDYISSFIGGN